MSNISHAFLMAVTVALAAGGSIAIGISVIEYVGNLRDRWRGVA